MRGAIGFSAHKTNFISRAIRWLTKGKYSHSFIVTDVIKDRDGNILRAYILEANNHTVKFDLLEKYYDKLDAYVLYEPLNVSAQKIHAALRATEREFLHDNYGYLQLLGFAFTIGLQRLGIKTKNPIKLGTICSELDWFYCKLLKSLLFGHLDRDSVSPQDLEDILRKKTSEFKMIEKKEYGKEVEYDG